MIDGQHNAEQVLSANHIMASTTLPAPGASQEFTKPIHDTIING
jgi:hypothetical protein